MTDEAIFASSSPTSVRLWFSLLKVKPAGLRTCFPHTRKSFIRAEPSERSEALQKASNMSWEAFFSHCNINEKRKRLVTWRCFLYVSSLSSPALQLGAGTARLLIIQNNIQSNRSVFGRTESKQERQHTLFPCMQIRTTRRNNSCGYSSDLTSPENSTFPCERIKTALLRCEECDHFFLVVCETTTVWLIRFPVIKLRGKCHSKEP